MFCRNTKVSIGGQSIPLYDYYLAPGVAKSFIKNFCDILETRYDDVNATKLKEDMREFMNSHGKRIINDEGKEFTRKAIEVFDSDDIIYDFEHCWSRAYTRTYRDTYQSQEALVHNLNTMNSRAGYTKCPLIMETL